MAKSFNVNTHHAFLNTEIVLKSELPSVELIDELTGIVYNINGSPLTVKHCAGRHKLYCQRYDEEIIVEIEDTIKLGGGRTREAFVFDDNPWVFVVTKDRLYATNTETKEEKVEFNLVPDEIQGYRKRYGKTCDYFYSKPRMITLFIM